MQEKQKVHPAWYMTKFNTSERNNSDSKLRTWKYE